MWSVRKAYTALMLLLARATDRELARIVAYLKEENRILRARLPERINVTPKERQRLLRFGRHLGRAMYQAVTIVSPGTFLRWLREERKAKPRKRGRPRTADDLRELILLMARDNDWGYTKPHPHYAPLRFGKQLLRFAWGWSIQWDMGHRTSRGEFDGVA